MVAGHGPSDGRCLPCPGVSGSAVCIPPCTSHGRYKHSPNVKNLALQCSSRNTPLCSASSGSNRRNSDFSRHRHGFSRGRNRQNDERDNFENLEESEMFSSKNGPLLTSSGSSKFQATATPGPREKEIVELFRKVQAQLRERAAVKEERKIEESQKKGKESETVDSLLKLLRKHSVQQGKRSSGADSRDFILETPDRSGLFSEDRTTSIFDSNSSVKLEKRENEAPITSRPRSSFQRRSPVSRVKVQSTYSEYDEEPVTSVSQTDVESKGKHVTLEPALEIEPEAEPTFSGGDVFDDMSDDEISDVYEDDDHNASHQNAVENSNLSEMKLTDLRALAKSRGLKGYSKLKKHELIELLSGDSI